MRAIRPAPLLSVLYGKLIFLSNMAVFLSTSP
nr:MAG TPA: hypothetical protein [Caudoviricetes sp.]